MYQGLSFGFEDLVALVNNIEVLEGVVPDVILLDSPDQMVKPSLYRDEWANERELYRKLLEFTKERNKMMDEMEKNNQGGNFRIRVN